MLAKVDHVGFGRLARRSGRGLPWNRDGRPPRLWRVGCRLGSASRLCLSLPASPTQPHGPCCVPMPGCSPAALDLHGCGPLRTAKG